MVTARRRQKIERVVAARQRDLVVVLEDIHDPHNAEAVLRSCDVFGVQEAYFIFEQEAYYNPKRVGKTSSSSANKWLTLHTLFSTRQCLSQLQDDGYQILTTVVPNDETESIFDGLFVNEKLALVFGNEHRGVSDVAMAMADRQVSIPVRGMVESLNISVAAAIFLFEVTRQRLAGHTDFSLPQEQQAALIDSFVQR